MADKGHPMPAGAAPAPTGGAKATPVALKPGSPSQTHTLNKTGRGGIGDAIPYT